MAPIFQMPKKANLNDIISSLQAGPSASLGVPQMPDITGASSQLNDIASSQLAAAAQSRLAAQAPATMPQIEADAYPSVNTGPKQVRNWIVDALNVLHMPDTYEPGIANMVMHESGGNPSAINRTDSNALAGHPSQGLMQTIPGTFKEYALPGYNKDILDPISNLIAGIRYARKNYGKQMLMNGGRKNSAGEYEGY